MFPFFCGSGCNLEFSGAGRCPYSGHPNKYPYSSFRKCYYSFVFVLEVYYSYWYSFWKIALLFCPNLDISQHPEYSFLVFSSFLKQFFIPSFPIIQKVQFSKFILTFPNIQKHLLPQHFSTSYSILFPYLSTRRK